MINIGSTTAFEDVVSLLLEGFYLSYFMTISMLLYRRLRGDIKEPSDENELLPPSSRKTAKYVWGRWRIKGVWGTLNNVLACIYVLVVGFFSFWPSTLEVTPAKMNYSSLVLGAVVIMSVLYYFGWARKHFRGPIIEVNSS